ncbi:MAG: hypothetical protein H7256_01550 [Bdellovibrio sp.]|nr:hypothetical protein [Bdellovibrio sp.]
MKMKQLILGFALALSAQTVLAEVTVTPLTTVTHNDENESLLADSFGKTLYVFDPDQGSKSSVCIGDCAEAWPPYIVTAAEAKNLVAPLAVIERANKKLQLTYEGRPVYTYILERNPGQDLGDGIGGVWHYVELDAVVVAK